MDIHSAYQILIDAAKHIGAVGATVAVLEGSAKAAGVAAFDGIKKWVGNKFGSDSVLDQAIQAIEAKPDDPVAQQTLLNALECQPTFLREPEIIGHLNQLQSLQLVRMANSSGININSQSADKIVNATTITTLNM